MAIKVASWNLQERLAIPEHTSKITESIKSLDADVVMLPDALWLGNPLHGADAETAGQALDSLAEAGYDHIAVDYGTLPGQWAGRYSVALSRLKTETTQRSVPLHDRKMPWLMVHDRQNDTALSIFGIHLDDASEPNRLWEITNLLRLTDMIQIPITLIGDFNAVHGQTIKARLLSSKPVRQLASVQPRAEGRNAYERQHGRLTKAERLVEMNSGSVMKAIVEHGFYDADRHRRPTFPARHPLVQLDHIMVDERVRATDFWRHDQRLTDHRPISAMIHL